MSTTMERSAMDDLARDKHNCMLLLHTDGKHAEVWNPVNKTVDHILTAPESVRHAMRHDFCHWTLTGNRWMRENSAR